jgi:hypothetical protein
LGLGYNFANLLRADISNLELGGLIDNTNRPHPDGSLLREGKTIWFINHNARYGIPNMQSFELHGFNLDNIVPINQFDKELLKQEIS